MGLRQGGANYEKHGITFVGAASIFARPHLTERSDRKDERRWLAIGRLEGRLITVIYTRRSERIRIISARRARDDERRRYHQNIA